MSKDTFTWHPDQDDEYDGARYGSTTLQGLPFSAFDKNIGKSFTMKGDDDDTLTLSPTGGDAYWCKEVPSISHVSEFNVTGGTFAIRPPQAGTLTLGAYATALQTINLNIGGTFLARQTNFIGFDSGFSPEVTFEILPRGKCCISEGGVFSGTFAINIHDLGSMSVSALVMRISNGTYLANGISNAGRPSLELIASRSLANPQSGWLEIQRHEIVCKSASISRLEATALSLTETDIRAADSASLLIACDTIDVDSNTVFAIGQGSAAITFTGSEKNEAPFDFFKKSYPKGLFNFITTEGANQSAFKFLNIGSAFDLSKMQADGVITINGAPDTQHKCDWRLEADGSNKYFVIFLKS